MDNISMIIVVFSAFVFGTLVVYIIRCDIFVANFSIRVREVYELNEDICNKISTNENFFHAKVYKKGLILDDKREWIEILESLEEILQKLSEISQRIDGFFVYNRNIEKEKELLQKTKNKVALVKWQIESKKDKELE